MGFAELVTGTPSLLEANLPSLNGREQRSCLRAKPTWKKAQWNDGKRLVTLFKLLDPAMPNSPHSTLPFCEPKSLFSPQARLAWVSITCNQESPSMPVPMAIGYDDMRSCCGALSTDPST